MRSLNESILTNGNAAGDLASSVVSLEYQLGCSIQATMTGAPVGTLKLQGSNDFGTIQPAGPDNGGAGVVNWTDIADSSGPVTGAGTFSWNYNGVFYKWIRVVYTFTSGTGTINIRINTKGF